MLTPVVTRGEAHRRRWDFLGARPTFPEIHISSLVVSRKQPLLANSGTSTGSNNNDNAVNTTTTSPASHPVLIQTKSQNYASLREG